MSKFILVLVLIAAICPLVFGSQLEAAVVAVRTVIMRGSTTEIIVVKHKKARRRERIKSSCDAAASSCSLSAASCAAPAAASCSQ